MEGQAGRRRREERQGEGIGEVVLTVLLKACRWCERRGATVGGGACEQGSFWVLRRDRQEIGDMYGQMGAGDRTIGKGILWIEV